MIHNSKLSKKKAFTLIELLIVIAIIGILFIVLVSKVDFATDKAKATGVQTDFRSFQMAFEAVSKEKAGFNSFGWNTGDTDGNRVRNSYDEGDKACTESGCTECKQDGVIGPHEVWTGHKVYTETWDDTCFYTLVKPGTTFAADGYDKDAIFELETAINKNLDPKLHITIDAKTGLITMANGAQDPWNTQYHGAYISAEDGMDRGAIVMYSNGANQKFGTKHKIANGLVTTAVSKVDADHPDNNKDGADDYALVVCYTYTNGHGETGILTDGFSNNQNFFTGNAGVNNVVNGGAGNAGNAGDDGMQNGGNNPGKLMSTYMPTGDFSKFEPGMYKAGSNYGVLLKSWDDILAEGILKLDADGMLTNGVSAYYNTNSKATALEGDIILPNDGSIKSLGKQANKYGGPAAFAGFTKITSVVIPDSVTEIAGGCFYECRSLQYVKIPEGVTFIGADAFAGCWNLYTLVIPSTMTNLADNKSICAYSSALVEIVNLSSLNIETDWGKTMFATYAKKIINSYEESTMTRDDNGCVWFTDDEGNVILCKVFNNSGILRLPSSYNGKSYVIDNWAIMHNDQIEHLYVSEGVSAIKQDFVKKCSNLKSITIEKNEVLTLIDARIYFDDCPNLTSIYVPQHLVEEYKNDSVWSKFADLIKPIV